MAESRANRVSENGIWRYLNEDDAEFVFFSEPDYRVEAVDDFLDGMHGVNLPEDTISMLQGMRHDAFQAFMTKNIPLMEANLRGLHMACRAVGMLDAAKVGVKFKQGRKPNTGGQIRKAIARFLAKSNDMKNAELWEAIKAKPPRGWAVFNNRTGDYIEGPKASDGMDYRRFCNIAAEERRKNTK